MAHKSIGRYAITRTIRRRVPLQGPGHGFTTEEAGRERVTLQVEVDVERLCLAIGLRAALNKKPETRLQSGSVIVRVISREPA